MKRLDQIPSRVQALWCQFLTINDTLTKWARVSKCANEATKVPVAWRETVQIDVSNWHWWLFETELKKLSCRCNVLIIHGGIKEVSTFVLKYIQPRDHLIVSGTHISALAIPKSVAILTFVGSSSWVDDTVEHISTLNIKDTSFLLEHLRSFPLLQTLYSDNCSAKLMGGVFRHLIPKSLKLISVRVPPELLHGWRTIETWLKQNAPSVKVEIHVVLPS